jgi:hypothetical protein
MRRRGFLGALMAVAAAPAALVVARRPIEIDESDLTPKDIRRGQELAGEYGWEARQSLARIQKRLWEQDHVRLILRKES